ncbi:MAG TPA: penicillin-binding transpeptidase domain-containing protein, partial [Solirubrobacterales bacterium]|nr:penicillin-binding transpeptidase domain-containing protein [Solirubrobacterales bacterium]
EMASVAQTIGNRGIREPTSIVANRGLRSYAKPVRVMSRKIAAELTELMVGVVTSGTGTAAAIPQAQVAGKTGTAELGPKPGQQSSPNPVQRKDAWFAAFAPADRAKLAIGVLLVEAEAAGGEVAAPAAARVLETGL